MRAGAVDVERRVADDHRLRGSDLAPGVSPRASERHRRQLASVEPVVGEAAEGEVAVEPERAELDLGAGSPVAGEQTERRPESTSVPSTSKRKSFTAASPASSGIGICFGRVR
ncbi:MAG TPA: hypothetical protein VM184_07725 [Gaiellaceae bacterium]|nr:hypothetical protein [Gaiellaceae bacterium]